MVVDFTAMESIRMDWLEHMFVTPVRGTTSILNHNTQGTLKGKGSEIPSDIMNRKISSQINMVGHEKCIGTLHWSILKIKTEISKEHRMVSVKTSLYNVSERTQKPQHSVLLVFISTMFLQSNVDSCKYFWKTQHVKITVFAFVLSTKDFQNCLVFFIHFEGLKCLSE